MLAGGESATSIATLHSINIAATAMVNAALQDNTRPAQGAVQPELNK